MVLVEAQPLGLVTVTVIVTDEPVGAPAVNLIDLDPAPDVIVPFVMDQL